MRTFRILAALMMAVVCVSLSSCSKDDDDSSAPITNSPDINLLYGTWVREYLDYDKTSRKDVFTFNRDNTWSETDYKGGEVYSKPNGTFVYYKDARMLALTFIDTDDGYDADFVPTYYILELNENSLTWDLGDDGAFTFKRQK
ncbi:lipocalin family protein [Bacteroides fragilis]|uniref:lipocalin family protein n=1 Tax=Bacteroides fragilis TaxID=817 RepID=UPI00202FAF43|nr:lipocalin family protein [Bacteroides fragilis]MCM0383658.1 lipocalin family protein [Bacteroides fragilis]